MALGLAVGLAGAGCSTAIRPEVLKAWIGRPAAALEREWGTPTREVPDGALRILIYEQFEKRSGSDFQAGAGRRAITSSDAPSETYRSPTVYARSYLFWVNPEGTIVHSDVRNP